MAKKLIFRKNLGGNNLSIDEENREANVWTATNFSDFGVFSVVYFDGNPYVNITGVFTTTDPFQDITNWEQFQAGEGGKIKNIVEVDGIVTVSYNDSTPDLVFPEGHTIQNNGVDQPEQSKLNFVTNTNVVENSANNSLDVYNSEPRNSTDSDGVQFVVSGNRDGNLPIDVFKRLRGTADEIVVTQGFGSGADTAPNTISAPQVTTNKDNIAINTPKIESLVGSSGNIGNINGVELSNVTNNQILQFSVGDASEGTTLRNVDPAADTLEDLSSLHDVKLTPLSERDILEVELGNATIDLDISANVSTFRMECEDGLLFTRSDGVAVGPLRVYLSRDAANPVDSVLYSFGSDTLVITITFENEITSTEIIDKFIEAVQTSWSNQTDESRRLIGNVVFTRRGNWTKQTNPGFVPATKATGLVEFEMGSTDTETDTGEFRFSISARPGGTIIEQTVTPGNFTGTNAFDGPRDYIDALVIVLNNNSAFSGVYIASRTDDRLVVTANNDGSQDNGLFNFEVLDSMGIVKSGTSGGLTAATTSPFSLSGGVNDTGNQFSAQWENRAHDHEVPLPGLFHDGTATLHFNNGGHTFVNKSIVNNIALNEISNVMTNNAAIGSVFISSDGIGWQAENATPSEFFVELGNRSNISTAVIPLINPRFDSNYTYTIGNDFFTVRATGAYEFELAFTKSFAHSETVTGTSGEQVEFYVTKNGVAGVVGGNDWAHPAESNNNSLVALSPAFTVPISGTVGTLGAATRLIIDLNAGDTIQIVFSYINLGVVGLTMTDGPQSKSWMRAKRVQ